MTSPWITGIIIGASLAAAADAAVRIKQWSDTGSLDPLEAIKSHLLATTIGGVTGGAGGAIGGAAAGAVGGSATGGAGGAVGGSAGGATGGAAGATPAAVASNVATGIEGAALAEGGSLGATGPAVTLGGAAVPGGSGGGVIAAAPTTQVAAQAAENAGIGGELAGALPSGGQRGAEIAAQQGFTRAGDVLAANPPAGGLGPSFAPYQEATSLAKIHPPLVIAQGTPAAQSLAGPSVRTILGQQLGRGAVQGLPDLIEGNPRRAGFKALGTMLGANVGGQVAEIAGPAAGRIAASSIGGGVASLDSPDPGRSFLRGAAIGAAGAAGSAGTEYGGASLGLDDSRFGRAATSALGSGVSSMAGNAIGQALAPPRPPGIAPLYAGLRIRRW